MFNVLLLIKALLIVSLCQGLTIYQTDYENHRGHEQKSTLMPDNSNLMAMERENFKTTSGWLTNQASESSSNYAHATPQQNSLKKNILSQTNVNSNEPSSAYYLENFAHIQPIFYEYFNPIQTTAARVSEQPVHAVNTESDINLRAPFEAAKSSWKIIQTLPVHFNNKIYHINRRASPLANNVQKYPSNIVRKQRNLNENLYNNNNSIEINNNNNDDHDDKLIEQNSKKTRETINVSDKPGGRNVAAASLSSIKQPLSSSITSHEIRYLQ